MCRHLHWSPALADVSELKVNEKGIKIEFPNKDDIMEMKIKIMPYDGHYKDGTCACAARERHTRVCMSFSCRRSAARLLGSC